MSEFTASAEQTVASGSNVLFTDTAVNGGKCIVHRSGSGLITLRGLTNQCNARFLIEYSGNIAIPTGGTVEEISLALAINGEPIASSVMRVTPAAAGNYFNVSTSAYISVPSSCCLTVAVENTSGQDILAESSNIIVTRVA